MEFSDIDRDELAQFFKELEHAKMPFGRFGPKDFPPSGVHLVDLSYEYLDWFQKQGFPKSRLGELMEMVYQVKAVGADMIFSPLQKVRGGRRPLNKTKVKPCIKPPQDE